METIIGIFILISIVLTIGVISEGMAEQMTNDNDGEENEPR